MAKQAKTVDDVVLALLGKRAETMSAKERNAAVRAFIDAGKGAVQARTGSLTDAAEAMRRGKRLLADGRVAMAGASKLGGPATVPDRAWSAHRRALREHRGGLIALDEVVGTAVGYRRRAGVETSERVVVVYVRQKRAPDELDRAQLIPPSLLAGKKEVPVDVVEVGEFVEQLEAGESMGPQGSPIHGTVGVFARENGSNRLVALTAMHVTGRSGTFPPGLPLTLCAPAGGAVLGELLRGTKVGIDAAAVLVTASTAGSNQVMGVRGRRGVSESGDFGTAVRMLGARSGVVGGRIANPSADFDLPQRTVRDAILVEMATQDGDSGAALLDNSGLVLGLLAGRFKGQAVFSPIMQVLQALDCNIRPN